MLFWLARADLLSLPALTHSLSSTRMPLLRWESSNFRSSAKVCTIGARDTRARAHVNGSVAFSRSDREALEAWRVIVEAGAPVEGYLHKKKSKSLLGGWNKRWFVADPVAKSLSYFSTQADAREHPPSPSGIISFDSISNVAGTGPLTFQVSCLARRS